MRYEWRLGLAFTLVFILGAFGADIYARLAAPYYRAITGLLEIGHPWKTLSIEVIEDENSRSRVLRAISEVRRRLTSIQPAALVVSTVQVGEVIETPLVFWAAILLWPVPTTRDYFVRLVVGIPVFLGLEAAVTGCQLIHPLAEASAVLAGESNPLTLWERWSRFLEAGGQLVLIVVAALAVVGLGQSLQTRMASRSPAIPSA